MNEESKRIERIRDHLKKYQEKGRYQHTLGVVKAASSLARCYGVSEEKAKLAALLHDYAKDFTEQELKNYIDAHKIKVDQSLYETYQLLHGVVGAYIAEAKYQIEDPEILLAIRYHTTGRPNMTPLEKIIYLSDFIEENRNYPEVQRLRELAYKNLDRAMLQGFNNTIKYLIATDKVLHCNTVEARNQILKNLYSKEKKK